MSNRSVIVPRPAILDGFDHSGYWIRSVQSHACLQIALVAKGTCTASIAGRDYQLLQGSVVLLDPDHDLITRARGRGSRYSGLLCDWTQRQLCPVDPTGSNQAWRPAVGEPPQPAWSSLLGRSIDPVMPPIIARRVAPLLAVAVRRWWQGQPGRLRATALLTEIMVCLLEWADAGALGHQERDLSELGNRAHVWVREHVYRRPTVDDVAKAMGLTRAHFTRRYTENRESGPGEMIRTLILEQLEADLRSGSSPDVLAARFGWSSARQLAQFVSRATGTTWRTWLAGVSTGTPQPP